MRDLCAELIATDARLAAYRFTLTMPSPRDSDSPSTFYVSGGTLPPGAPSYIERQADHDLYTSLRAGEYCYVLNSRQMGKSSLCVRTIERLKQDGFRTCFLDLTKFGGKNLTPEQWYSALIAEAGRDLGRRAEFIAYARQMQDAGPMQRFFDILRDLALSGSTEFLIVFVDEVDVTRSLPFSSDEFFAGIRQCFIGRATDPELNRLVFCLLGTATPAELIQDTRTSPFNIGKRIEVLDFTASDSAVLARELPGGKPVLNRILYWTGGHPYLTQRLCRSVSDAVSVRTSNTPNRIQSRIDRIAIEGVGTPALVDHVCEELFLNHRAREADDNLAFVRNRLLKSEVDLTALLELYARMRAGKRVADDETNTTCSVIKLSGVARVEDGMLRVRNRLYQYVFDRAWVVAHLPDAEVRRQRRAYRRGVVRSGSVALVVVIIIAGLALNSMRLARISTEKRALAEYESYAADVNLMRTVYEDNDLISLARLLDETRSSPHRGLEWYFWNAMLHDSPHELDTPRGYGDVVISSDGKTIGIRDADRATAAIYTYPNLNLLHRIDHIHKNESIVSIAGVWALMTMPSFASIVFRDALTSKPLGLITVPPGAAMTGNTGASSRRYTLAISWVAKGDFYSRDVTVWNCKTFSPMHHMTLSKRRIQSVTVSDDGKFVAIEEIDAESPALISNYYSGRYISVVDLVSGATIDRFPSGGIVGAFQLSSDGNYLCFSLEDSPTLRVRDVRAHRYSFKSRAAGVNFIAISDDNHRMLTSGTDLAACLWDLRIPKLLEKRRGAMAASMPSNALTLAVSGAGTRVYTTLNTNDRYGAQIANTWASVRGINEEGRLVVTTGHALRILDATSLKPVQPPIRSVGSLVLLSSDANWRLQVLRSGGSEIVSTSTGRTLCKIPIWTDEETGMDVRTGRVAALDNQYKFVACFDRYGRELSRHQFPTSPPQCCRLSPNGTTVAVGLYNGDVSLIDVRTGELRQTLTGYPASVVDLTFTHDGNRLAVVGVDNNVMIFELASGRRPTVCHGHTAGIFCAAFSVDDRRLGTSGYDGTARIWDPTTGKQLLQLPAEQIKGRGIAFHPDGQRFYVSDYAGNIRIYRAPKVGK